MDIELSPNFLSLRRGYGKYKTLKAYIELLKTPLVCELNKWDLAFLFDVYHNTSTSFIIDHGDGGKWVSLWTSILHHNKGFYFFPGEMPSYGVEEGKMKYRKSKVNSDLCNIIRRLATHSCIDLSDGLDEQMELEEIVEEDYEEWQSYVDTWAFSLRCTFKGYTLLKQNGFDTKYASIIYNRIFGVSGDYIPDYTCRIPMKQVELVDQN